MKRLFVLLTIFSIFLAGWQNAWAQTATPPPQGSPPPPATSTPAAPLPAPSPTATTPPLISAEDLVPLYAVGMPNDEAMHGPYDSKRLRFGLPPAWKLQPGAMLYLDLNTFFSSPGSSTGFVGANGGTLEISFNSELIATVILDWVGDRSLQIPIPDAALTPKRSDGRHELYLFLNSAVDCTFDNQTTLTVSASSQFYFPHDIQPPLLDLALLPRPIFQVDSFQEQPAVLVLPDNPAAAELEAAYTVLGSMARMTRNTLVPEMLFASEATPDVLRENHVLFVGMASGLKAFGDAEWPLPFADGRLRAETLQPQDGVIQMMPAPDAPTLTWLAVTANDEEGLRKAARAFSSGSLRTSGRPDLALVADVEGSVVINQVLDDRTFGDLGYEAQTATGFGVHYFEFEFYVPPGMVSAESSSLELRFTHSAMIDLARSGMLVYLNGQIIGSARFTEQSAKLGDETFPLPRFTVLPGINRLTIAADLIPSNFCSNLVLSNLWITITPDSLVHMPLMPVQFALMDFRDLGGFPYPFTSSPTLSTLGIVLPPDAPETWRAASGLAAYLARNAAGTILEFGVAYGDALPEDFRQRDLILVGRPSRLPVLETLGSTLPVPFDENDLALERGLQVSYRIPPGTSLGYLELFPPPWAQERTVLGVFGSTFEGVTWAVQTLLEGSLRGKLSGNFAVVRGQNLFTADTRIGIGSGNLSMTAVPGAAATPEVQITPPVQTPPPAKPGWIVPVIAGSSVLAVLLIVIVALRSMRKENG